MLLMAQRVPKLYKILLYDARSPLIITLFGSLEKARNMCIELNSISIFSMDLKFKLHNFYAFSQFPSYPWVQPISPFLFYNFFWGFDYKGHLKHTHFFRPIGLRHMASKRNKKFKKYWYTWKKIFNLNQAWQRLWHFTGCGDDFSIDHFIFITIFGCSSHALHS